MRLGTRNMNAEGIPSLHMGMFEERAIYIYICTDEMAGK